MITGGGQRQRNLKTGVQLAVEAVVCEPLSERQLPVYLENTGNFRRCGSGRGVISCFLHGKSDGYAGILYASKQGIFARE